MGGANTDYLVRGGRLPGPGETTQGEDFQEAPGGKGANQSVAAARLGARVALLARIGADLIRPNSTEAAVLTGVTVRDRASAVGAARKLLERGAGAACVQAGDEGDVLVWRGGERWLPRIPVKSVDATGAGDAFAAALAVALAEGRSWEEAGPFASAAAALATTELGAQAGLPRREAVAALLARVGAGG